MDQGLFFGGANEVRRLPIVRGQLLFENFLMFRIISDVQTVCLHFVRKLKFFIDMRGVYFL